MKPNLINTYNTDKFNSDLGKINPHDLDRNSKILYSLAESIELSEKALIHFTRVVALMKNSFQR